MILIGFMGSGKSSIARRLHKEGHSYVDLDAYIEASQKQSIADIFKVHDEAYFREIEYRALQEVVGKYDVISTGGGIVTHPLSFGLLKEIDEPIIWLDAPIHILIARTRGNNRRPLARDSALMRERYEARESLYCELSDIRIDTSKNKTTCIKEINAFLNDV